MINLKQIMIDEVTTVIVEVHNMYSIPYNKSEAKALAEYYVNFLSEDDDIVLSYKTINLTCEIVMESLNLTKEYQNYKELMKCIYD